MVMPVMVMPVMVMPVKTFCYKTAQMIQTPHQYFHLHIIWFNITLQIHTFFTHLLFWLVLNVFSEWQRPALRQTRVQDVVPLRPPLNPPLRETFSSTFIHPHFFYIRLDSFSWKGCEPQPWKINTNKFPPTRKSPNDIFGNETRHPLAKIKNTWTTEKKGKSRGILKGGCLETVLKAVGRTMSVSGENLN